MNPKLPFARGWYSMFPNKLPTPGRMFKFFVWALCVLLWAQPAWAFDYSRWEALLKKHVRPTTLDGVRFNALPYGTLKNDPAFAEVVKQFESFSLSELKSREEKLAFWINAYNVFAVKMVLDHYPVDSIKDARSLLQSVRNLYQSVWDKRAGTIGGKPITLNEIEHGILRKMDEPRIHMAIVCASVSCPDIREEAYWPDRLEDQLTQQSRHFLMNPGKGLRVDKDRKTIYLSPIFDWFEEDFESKGGVLKYITPYAPERHRPALQSGDYDIEYMDYNWALNKLPE